MRSIVFAKVAMFVLLAGCASAPSLTDVGSQVRMITSDQAKECKFVKVVQYTESQFFRLGKDPTVMAAIGASNLRNVAGRAGANAIIITNDDSNFFMGSLNYQGEAYTCP